VAAVSNPNCVPHRLRLPENVIVPNSQIFLLTMRVEYDLMYRCATPRCYVCDLLWLNGKDLRD